MPRPPRYSMPAGHVLVAVAVALAVGTLLNADGLRATAERQPFGWQRDVALRMVAPVRNVSHALQLDRPRQAIDLALGRRDAPVAAAARASANSDPAPRPAPGPAPTASPTPTAAPDRRQIDGQDPLRLYIGGDSMVGQFGPALANLAEDSGVVDAQYEYEFSSGLTRPDYIDWPAKLRTVGADDDPDAVVLVFGGNDAQPMKLDGIVHEPGAPAWKAEYRRRVNDLMTQLTGAGHSVYWIGMPIVESASFRERVRMLNSIYAGEAGRHRGVAFIDSWDLFAGRDGRYAEYLEDPSGATVDMRLDDGVHLTTAGAQHLARAVYAHIAADWSLPSDET